MHVTLCSLLYNRDKCLQRLLRCYLEQDYTGPSTLLIFNSGRVTTLPELDLPANKQIRIINRDTSISTGMPYTSVGEKHNDAVSYIEEGGLVNFSDPDDVYFSNHISEGVRGMERAYEHNKLAYKPRRSYFKSSHGVFRNENVYEPSIFVDALYVKNSGFYPNSVKYHDSWLVPLVESNKILVDPSGESTFCYDWGGIPVYKMSGKGEDNDANFQASQMVERDFGTGITTPITAEDYNTQCTYILKNYVDI